MTDLVPVTRTIVGDRDRLAHYLRTTSAAGRLVTAPGSINPTIIRPGQFMIRVTVREPAPALSRLTRFDRAHPVLSPCLKALAFGVSVLALIAGALFGLGYLIVASVGLRTLANVGLLVLIVLGGILYACTRGSGDGHRKGYGYHWSKCK